MMKIAKIILLGLFCFGLQNKMLSQDSQSKFKSALLLKEKKSELKFYTSLYTLEGTDGFSDFNTRSSYLASFFQYFFGDGPNFNWGVDAIYRSNVQNDLLDNSSLKTLSFDNSTIYRFDTNGDTLRNAGGGTIPIKSRAGLVHLGPKVKFAPIKSIPDLVFQQTIYFSINEQVDSRNLFVSQLAYYKQFTSKFGLYAEASIWLPREQNTGQWYFLKTFWGYMLAPKVQIYAMNTFPHEYGGGIKLFTGFGLELDLFASYLFSWKPWVQNGDQPMTMAFGLRQEF